MYLKSKLNLNLKRVNIVHFYKKMGLNWN